MAFENPIRRGGVLRLAAAVLPDVEAAFGSGGGAAAAQSAIGQAKTRHQISPERASPFPWARKHGV
jgi:hypothetical protein